MDYGYKIFDKLIYDACHAWTKDYRYDNKKNKKIMVKNHFGFKFSATSETKGKFDNSVLMPWDGKNPAGHEKKIAKIKHRSKYKKSNALRRAQNFKNALYLSFLTQARNEVYKAQQSLKNSSQFKALDADIKTMRIDLERLEAIENPTKDQIKKIETLKKSLESNLVKRSDLIRRNMDGLGKVRVIINFKDSLLNDEENSDRPPGEIAEGVDTIITGGDLEGQFGDGTYMLYCGD